MLTAYVPKSFFSDTLTPPFPLAQPISVLVVEDEMIIAAKISLHLEQLGYAVAGILPRGEEAVLHCRKAPPDILLLDINLRGMLDGVETAMLLEKEGIHIPTIYLTANADAATFERARRTRPRAFVAKPYKKTELYRAISLAVHQRAGPTKMAPASPPPSPELQQLNDRIFVKYKDQMVKLFLRDILYVKAERAYCQIKTTHTDYTLSISMGRLAEQLTSPSFCACTARTWSICGRSMPSPRATS